VGDYIRLVENWLDTLNAERERSGEVKKLRLDTQSTTVSGCPPPEDQSE
jgi:hypothetical protein